eukprot:m.91048 g.91048  ORF g.91048 m.91048 type:complete len:183 (-) comp8485_c0_seq1:1383-1931(-)
MADIDDLLDEVEQQLSKGSIASEPRSALRSAGSSKPTSSNISLLSTQSRSSLGPTAAAPRASKKVEIDDLDDLLEDIRETGPPPPRASVQSMPRERRQSLDESVKAQVSKCFPPLLGGSAAAPGINKGESRKPCSSLRCTKCDFKVCMFDNYRWDDSWYVHHCTRGLPSYLYITRPHFLSRS